MQRCWGALPHVRWDTVPAGLLSPPPARLANFGFNLFLSLHAGGRGIGPSLPAPENPHTEAGTAAAPLNEDGAPAEWWQLVTREWHAGGGFHD